MDTWKEEERVDHLVSCATLQDATLVSWMAFIPLAFHPDKHRAFAHSKPTVRRFAQT